MGNSKSNTAQTKNSNSPLKPALKKAPVAGPVNGYRYAYPHIPEEYTYPVYPGYPVVSKEAYINKQYYPQPQAKNKVYEQSIPINDRNHNQVHHLHHSHHHQHRQLTTYGHNHPPYNHHRHHHHHRPTEPIEKKIVNPPILQDRANSPPPPPPVQVAKPVSTIITTKVASPAPNKETLIPPPPPPIIVTDHPPTQSVMPKNISPSRLVTSDNFEKAPPIETNYVSKSPDSHSIHHYGSESITIVRRSPSRYATPGNRWYDHEYDKRIKSLTIKDD